MQDSRPSALDGVVIVDIDYRRPKLKGKEKEGGREGGMGGERKGVCVFATSQLVRY